LPPTATAAPARRPAMSAGLSAAVSLAVIGALALAARLVALPVSTEANMDPDAAHFMNVARCFARGQGFSNPAAWPAWMKPEKLPMPETFKEPGYPWAISVLTPLVGGSFRAGQLLSLLAGLAIPLLTWALARRMGLDRGVAFLAGLLAAVSPLLLEQSVRVMVESVFTFVFMLVWIALLPPPDAPAQRGALARDLGAGVLLGIAFMLRGQTLLAAPAVLALIALGTAPRAALRRGAVVLVAAIITASPFLMRNLRLFHSPFHSDVGAYGLWPYVDHLTFSHGLDHPPAVGGFVLTHIPQVTFHWIGSAIRFVFFTLPGDILGSPVWLVPLGAGLILSLGRARAWRFVHVLLAVTLLFIFAVNWDSRYFASGVPLWCLLTALGGVWMWRAIAAQPLWRGIQGRHLLAAVALANVVLPVAIARRALIHQAPPEIDAARAEAPFLRAHLAPDESVMVVTTSLYSWFADRFSVHLVIADEPRFMEVVRRLKVRYAALPSSRLDEFAARYPDQRLPRALVLDHRDDARDVTVFRVDAAAR